MDLGSVRVLLQTQERPSMTNEVVDLGPDGIREEIKITQDFILRL